MQLHSLPPVRRPQLGAPSGSGGLTAQHGLWLAGVSAKTPVPGPHRLACKAGARPPGGRAAGGGLRLGRRCRSTSALGRSLVALSLREQRSCPAGPPTERKASARGQGPPVPDSPARGLLVLGNNHGPGLRGASPCGQDTAFPRASVWGLLARETVEHEAQGLPSTKRCCRGFLYLVSVTSGRSLICCPLDSHS